jgi:hypothetical protein
MRLLLAFAVLATIVRSLRTLGRLRRVEPLRPAAPIAGTVLAVVPARNEEAVLADCLAGLRAQAVDRIAVVDDASTDGTGALAETLATEDPRITVVHTDGPPPGWKGKVHAMHRGVVADSDWLLFVDADVVLAPDAVSRLVATAEAAGADLVSTPAGPPERPSAAWPVLMPPALQMIGENAEPDGRGRKAFAIGHCILVRRTAYDGLGGWESLKDQRNEDIRLATAVRDHGGASRLVDGVGHASTSGMDPFAQGWASFRKSFVAGTRGSVPVLLGGGAGQVLLSLAPPLAVLLGPRRLGALGWIAQSAAHVGTARYMRAGTRLAPLAPFTSALFGGVLLDGAVRVLRGTSGWKGRAD